MIDISQIAKQPPYIKFVQYYEKALKNQQTHIDAICISSFDKKRQEVDSRYVNLKYIKDDKWIFFSNYNSKKANQFSSHNQISISFYWNKIDVQIRIKAFIEKASSQISDMHFLHRNEKKNALSISSRQSSKISSYESILNNYKKTLENSNLDSRPSYWGGYVFQPYYFEFWEGEESRLNKRTVFEIKNQAWVNYVLEP